MNRPVRPPSSAASQVLLAATASLGASASAMTLVAGGVVAAVGALARRVAWRGLLVVPSQVLVGAVLASWLYAGSSTWYGVPTPDTVGRFGRLFTEFGQTVYGATKAFVLYLSQGLAFELGPRGVYVQAVLPAATATSAHNLHLSMSAQGITYMAASGDSGTTLEPYSYPNYEPEVLMVGGTIATVNGSGVRTSEVGWSGSGGGWSTKAIAFNTRPSWQAGAGVPTTINFRMSPDISLNASGSGTGAYQFYFNGALTSGYVGTSFACPVFGGGLAVAEQKIINGGGLPANGAGKRRFGRIQDLIYSQNGRSDVWFDITSGNNGTLPNGSSSSCTVASQLGAPVIPSPPTNLVATAGNAQVSLTWSASSGATSYNIKRATVNGGPYSTVGTSASAGFTNTGLTNGTTYYYVVTAVNTAGESGNSNQASATPTAGGGGAQQLLLNPGFESGSASWTATAGVITNSASQAAHGGSYKAWLDGYGSSHTDSVYQQVTIPSTVTTATLSFWLHIDSAETTTSIAYDTLQVQIRNSSNVVLATLATYSNLNKATGYTQKSFNVAAYKGQTIRVYLLGVEDSSLQTSFVADDFALNVQ
jgi:xanthomonalisin